MSSLRQIPLHMLFLAGLAGPLVAEEPKPEAPARPTVVAQSPKVAYAGLQVVDLTPQDRAAAPAVPAGLGVRVGFVEPTGPSADLFEEGDVITRFDDQVIVNRDQFRALVRLRKPGEKVPVTIIRGAEPKVIALKLGEAKPALASARAAVPPPAADALPSARGIVIPPQAAPSVTEIGPNSIVIIGPNAGLPDEVMKRLEDMRSRGLRMQPGVSADELPTPPPGSSGRSATRSFSFGTGGVSSSASSIAVDEEGSVALEEKDGKKHATIKDNAGKVIFEGEVTTPEQRAKLSADVRRRLRLVEGGKFSIPGFEAAPAAEEPPAKSRKRKSKPEEGA